MNGDQGSDRVVLVTGGSRGIGRATARVLLHDGFHVVATYRSGRAEAESLRDESPDPERLTLVSGDLSRPDQASQVWRDALAVRGRLDVLVNNAGAWIPSPVTDEAAWNAGWDANLALNLTAPATLCRLAVEHFRTRGGGIIVNVTSRSAHRGDDAEHLAYGAAKGGLLALTRGIARGFARDRIYAYAVAPGPVATEMVAGDLELASRASSLPMGEITPPEDVAEAIAFLASGRSPLSSGTTIDISGADYVR